MEVCQFHVSKMDGNKGLPILHFQNGRKRRFANFPFSKRTEMGFPFLSISIKPIFHFPFSVSGPTEGMVAGGIGSKQVGSYTLRQAGAKVQHKQDTQHAKEAGRDKN